MSKVAMRLPIPLRPVFLKPPDDEQKSPEKGRLFFSATTHGFFKNRCVLFHRNHADLHVHKAGQRGHLHGFAGREVAVKIFAIDLVDLAELVHVGNKDGGLYHVVEAHAGFVQHRFQVLHALVRFFLDVAVFECVGCWVQANLSRNV